MAIVDSFVSYAISLRASDIHIEILEDTILIRYRVDGVLHEIARIPKEVYPAIVARIKLLGGLKIDEHLKPQDGRFRYQVGTDSIDVRVAIIPVFLRRENRIAVASFSPETACFGRIGNA